MKKRWMGMTALLIVIAAGVARADDEIKEKKVRELLALTGAGKLGKQVMDGMMDQFKGMPGMSPEFVKKFKAMAKPEALVDMIVPIYMKHLDEKTLDAAIAFYKTPEGRALIKAQPKIVQESTAAGTVWGRELAAKVMRGLRGERSGNFAVKKNDDMNRVRQLAALLAISRKMPMKDGRVDVYALVRNGDIGARHFSILRSARFGKSPSKDEIEKGDYTNFPYERFKGTVKPGSHVPLLWDKKPDERNGRVVGFSSGAVKYYPEADVQKLLEKHGQLKQEND